MNERFQKDFPALQRPQFSPLPEEFARRDNPDAVGSMLRTRMLFSRLVDADYSVSALDDDPQYLERATNDRFDPESLLSALYAYQETIRAASGADGGVNRIRDGLFARCGDAGEREPGGLFTLSAPTGTGKTLALLHFALRHCSAGHAERFPADTAAATR